jgi:predicted RNA-binding Zn-ribbon protein involved in translation (DUF1610 family)
MEQTTHAEEEVNDKHDASEEEQQNKTYCPVCGAEIIRVSRCLTCSFCGWGTCGL